MTILITGGGGQLAAAIAARRPDVTRVGRDSLDITDAGAVAKVLDKHRPAAVINCAAYTAVDRAEEEPDKAFAVNAVGPRTLARAAADRGVRLLHVSTDYVFGGQPERRPLSESDPPAALSAYGVTKLAGEQFVLAEHAAAAVVRTCGLYGHGGGNFVKTMLRLAESRDEVSVVADQHCTPTSCDDLAAVLLSLAEDDTAGVVHATNAGETTWAGFAEAVFAAAGKSTAVRPITTAEFGAAAPRPPYSVLACDRLAEPMRPWREAVAAFVAELA